MTLFNIRQIILSLFLIFPVCCFSQWLNTNSPHFSETAAAGDIVFGVEQNTGAYISTNKGNSWTLTSLNTLGLIKIAAEGTNIFAGTGQQETRGIYRSTNSGLSWTLVLSPTEIYAISCITINGNNVYASTGRSFYYSSNNGTNWTKTETTFFTYTISITGNKLFAGTEVSGVYFSTNNGLNWSQTSLNNKTVPSVKTGGGKIYSGTEDGLYISTNDGANFSLLALNNRYVSSLAISGNYIFAGTDDGVYYSTDLLTWWQKNQGLPLEMHDGPHLNVSANYIFASNPGFSTWRRDLSEIINVQKISSIIPAEFKLMQNYPNPFNPATRINFSLPQTSDVSLKIYNITGKKIAVLVNEKLSSGTYEYLFNAASLPSGIYYYSFQTPTYSETKSMVLLK